MATKNAAPAPPEDAPTTEAPELEPAAQVPTVVAGPPLPEPERARIWSEVELIVGALREHWTDEHRKLAEEHEAAKKVEEVTDNA